MRLTIDVPEPQETMSQACAVPLATRGVRWSESCLGQNAKGTGVCVIHHSGIIKYVGRTDAPTMSFGMRLRREVSRNCSKRGALLSQTRFAVGASRHYGVGRDDKEESYAC
jgi:hypothetical protein